MKQIDYKKVNLHDPIYWISVGELGVKKVVGMFLKDEIEFIAVGNNEYDESDVCMHLLDGYGHDYWILEDSVYFADFTLFKKTALLWGFKESDIKEAIKQFKERNDDTV